MVKVVRDLQISKKTCARIPTDEGEFKLCVYINNQEDKEHLALIMGEVARKSNVLVRVHSECFTGDVLGSRRCDCGEQLELSMQMIAQAGQGILIYLRQEGRGIGLLEKLKVYNLQDQGYDTVDANLLLGHEADERDYTMAALILKDLEVNSIRIMTNNPIKIKDIKKLGIPITARVPLVAAVNPENSRYIATKVKRMNHLLNLNLIKVDLPGGGNVSGNQRSA